MTENSRRNLLKAASAFSLALGTTSVPSTAAETDPSETDDAILEALDTLRPRRRLMADTNYENGVYVVEGRSSGDQPTAVVVAGQHGIEPAGWLTATQLTALPFETGKLVLIPYANPPAMLRAVYQTDDGDMNRHFPPGERPTLEAAAAIWEELERHDPDVVLDLHSSQGIYRSGVNTGLGQVVFPTEAGYDGAERATEWMNREIIRPTDYPSEYEFVLGTVQGDPDRPLLTHKVGHDLDVPGYLVEVTREATSLPERVTWETAITLKLLEENGIRVA